MNKTPFSAAELKQALTELRVKKRIRTEVTDQKILPRIDHLEQAPLSWAQERLWYLAEINPAASQAYHIPVALALTGAFDHSVLKATLDSVVARHEILRSRFVLHDGMPVQCIDGPDPGVPFDLHDLSNLSQVEREQAQAQLTQTFASRPFDLAHGPLIRCCLLRIAIDQHVLLVTQHHIVSDGWSIGVMMREVSTVYIALLSGRPNPLPPLNIQYADYAVWQRQWLSGERQQQQANYWKNRLTGVPTLLELPIDRPRPVTQSFAGARLAVHIDAALTRSLKRLSQQHGTTVFMTLLTAWAAVLSRLSGQQDLVIGTPTANRNRQELEGLIGFFVNTLALRIDLSGEPCVADLLGRVRQTVLEAQDHQDLPFEQVVEAINPQRSLAHNPLFQVMLAFNNTPQSGDLHLSGLKVSQLESQSNTTHFDLTLSLEEKAGALHGSLVYATALFEATTIERHRNYLLRLLEAMVADATQPVARIDLLSADERELLLHTWNQTEAPYPADRCIHQLFEEQAAKTPDAIAVVQDDAQLTYAELNAQANRLAHRLIAMGVQPDSRVAICVDRRPHMVIGLLAILKAGGAYVPLDPMYPPERLAELLADAQPVMVLADAIGKQALGTQVKNIIDVLSFDNPSSVDGRCFPSINLKPQSLGLTSAHLAYVIYTSGSTGKPKGVMTEHRALVNRLSWMQEAYELDPSDAILQKTPFSFDVSVWEFLWPLMTGARLVIAQPEGHKDPHYLRTVILEKRITTIHFVPSMLHLFLEGGDIGSCGSVRRVICSGEELSTSLAKDFETTLPGIPLHNLYGPTEAAIDVTSWTYGSEHLKEKLALTIGRPIWNTRIYLLDAQRQPVPMGAVGEIYIGGAGVARGYLNRPELTAERFIASPFVEGDRLYKTGDLGRYWADGNIEFLGRNDFQVKIRGFRIELGEIEAGLLKHSGVCQAVVLAREDMPGDKRLAAYYTVAEGAEVSAEVLKVHLSRTLPSYMMPAAYLQLPALPLTPNGKLDRKALPAPDGQSYETRVYEVPEGSVETALAKIWSEILRVKRVGRYDNFFELGGHSLLAMRVLARVRRDLSAKVILSELFAYPTLARFAQCIQMSVMETLPDMVAASREQTLPLSFAQQRLWFLSRMEGSRDAYHVPLGLRLKGRLDEESLRRALDRLVYRHESLRTTFGMKDGEPFQHIGSETQGLKLVSHDLVGRTEVEDALITLMKSEASAPFDLERGPLVRGRVIRVAFDDHVLLLTMHHIVADGWSLGVLTRELSALYKAYAAGEDDPLAPLTIQYADYAVWQRRWLSGDMLTEQADYWREALASAPAMLELPKDHNRPTRQDYSGNFIALEFEETLTGNLKALSQRHGTTMFMTVLTGWALVLSRLSGQEDIVVGIPSANRNHSELEGLIGFFVNTLALRIDLSGAPTVDELLGRVKSVALKAQSNQDLPFEQVVEILKPPRGLAHTPIFQVLLAWQNYDAGRLEMPGLSIEEANAGISVSKFDLTLDLSESEGRIVGTLGYATALFERETIERWGGYLRKTLEEMTRESNRVAATLPLLSTAERNQLLVEWNATETPYPQDQCVHELFESQVERNPLATAVIYEDRSLTYAELNCRANQLAHHLRSLGVGPDVLVAICMERSLEMVVGLLAILKAGGAYVPLDPAYPSERLRYMLKDSAPAALLTHDATKSALDAALVGLDTCPPIIDLERTTTLWANRPPENPTPQAVGLTSRHLAYVIYTSGSTGTPKGVSLHHSPLVNLLSWQKAIDDKVNRTLQISSISFDMSFHEIFSTLSSGSTLFMARGNSILQAERFFEYLLAHNISRVFLPTAVFNELTSVQNRAVVKQYLAVATEELEITCAGEQLRISDGAKEFFQTTIEHTLRNYYGPSETHVCTTYALPANVEMRSTTIVPIGRPIWNTRIYLLDEHREPVPIGAAGELYIGGAGVARGYLNRPELTAERFIKSPFVTGDRLYKTGDLARYLPDGNIAFLGRNDFQVKIRGFRIELGEIESRLTEHADVHESIVLARENAAGEKRLVAYYTGAELEVAALRAHVLQTLPEYMVPSAYIRLEAMPLSVNGKLDRRALPAPDEHAYINHGFESPRGATEESLAAIWIEVLGVERVGRHDDFFELGGHSLTAVRVCSKARNVLGISIKLEDFFLKPTISSMSEAIDVMHLLSSMAEPESKAGRLIDVGRVV